MSNYTVIDVKVMSNHTVVDVKVMSNHTVIDVKVICLIILSLMLRLYV